MIYKKLHGDLIDKVEIENVKANLLTTKTEINSNIAEIVTLLPDEIQAAMIEKDISGLLSTIGV